MTKLAGVEKQEEREGLFHRERVVLAAAAAAWRSPGGDCSLWKAGLWESGWGGSVEP